MGSFLDYRRVNKDDDNDHHSDHNYVEMLLDDLLFEPLPSDDDWPLGMVFNEVDRGLELSSSSSSSTTNNIIDTIINHHEHSLSSSSGDSLSSYCYPSFSAYFSEEPIVWIAVVFEEDEASAKRASSLNAIPKGHSSSSKRLKSVAITIIDVNRYH
eukprot:gene2050-2237_t